jgi:TATA-box binding protein (TBP) (component of TFIID and TFIIIB)
MMRNPFLTDPLAPPGIANPIWTSENNVVTVKLRCPVCLNDVFAALQPMGAKFFQGDLRVQVRIDASTAVSVHSEVLVCTGSKNLDTAICAALEVILALMQYDPDEEQPEAIKNATVMKMRPMFCPPNVTAINYFPVDEVKPQNIVGTLRTGCAVSLDTVNEILTTATYVCTVFPGLIFQYKKKEPDGTEWKISLSFFTSGAMIVTGSTNPSRIDEAVCFGAAKIWEAWKKSSRDNSEYKQKLMIANGVMNMSETIEASKQLIRDHTPVGLGTISAAAAPAYMQDSQDALTLDKETAEVNAKIRMLNSLAQSDQEEETHIAFCMREFNNLSPFSNSSSPRSAGSLNSSGLKRSVDASTYVAACKRTTPSPSPVRSPMPSPMPFNSSSGSL